jgi:putative copper export protein
MKTATLLFHLLCLSFYASVLLPLLFYLSWERILRQPLQSLDDLFDNVVPSHVAVLLVSR